MAEYGDKEIQAIKDTAVLSAKMDVIEKALPEINSNVKEIHDAVSAMPEKITECKEEIDRELKAHVNNHYISNMELINFEQKIELKMHAENKGLSEKITRVENKVQRSTWIISGMITAGTAIFYILAHTNLTLNQ